MCLSLLFFSERREFLSECRNYDSAFHTVKNLSRNDTRAPALTKSRVARAINSCLSQVPKPIAGMRAPFAPTWRRSGSKGASDPIERSAQAGSASSIPSKPAAAGIIRAIAPSQPIFGAGDALPSWLAGTSSTAAECSGRDRFLGSGRGAISTGNRSARPPIRVRFLGLFPEAVRCRSRSFRTRRGLALPEPTSRAAPPWQTSPPWPRQ